MSKQDFDSISFSNSTSNGGTQANKLQVAFFQLKNDGDEAVVRFMCDSTKDFEIFTTHITPTSNNRFMKVNCLRDANEPVSKCPLCESKNFKLSQTFCVPLIQYEKQSDGSVVATPKVWARPIAFAQKLKSYIDNYGPLSDIICKIIRHGAAGNLQTEFEVVPNLSKTIFRDDIYVKDTEAFKGYTALGKVIANKSAEDMRVYLETKSYPQHNTQETKQPTAETTTKTVETPVATTTTKTTKKTTKSSVVDDFAPKAEPTESVDDSRKMPWEL